MNQKKLYLLFEVQGSCLESLVAHETSGHRIIIHFLSRSGGLDPGVCGELGGVKVGLWDLNTF